MLTQHNAMITNYATHSQRVLLRCKAGGIRMHRSKPLRCARCRSSAWDNSGDPCMGKPTVGMRRTPSKSSSWNLAQTAAGWNIA